MVSLQLSSIDLSKILKITKDFCPIFDSEVNIEKCRHKTFWNSAERHGTPLSPHLPWQGLYYIKSLYIFCLRSTDNSSSVTLCLCFKIQHQIWPWLLEQFSQSLTNINLLCINFYHNYKLPKLNTIEPPNVTISWKRPPIQNTKLFPVKALQLKPLTWPPPVSDCDYFLGLTVKDFPLSILL